MTTDQGNVVHWDGAYSAGYSGQSCFQDQPRMSLQLLDAAAVTPALSVLDVGGGASTLADALIGRGFADITVLDISARGLQHARQRLGADAGRVQWLVTDILSWRPQRRYQVWHDRAVFHFLVASRARSQYAQTLHAATTQDAVAVFGCFAPDGPRQCSGLPVARYGPDELSAELGAEWMLVSHACEDHTTPGGVVQPFKWAAFRRRT